MRYPHPTASPDARGQARDTARCLGCNGILEARVATSREAAYPGVTILQCLACGVVETATMRAAAAAVRASSVMALRAQQARDAASKRGKATHSALYGKSIVGKCQSARCSKTICYTLVGRMRLKSYCDHRCRSAAGRAHQRSTAGGRAA